MRDRDVAGSLQNADVVVVEPRQNGGRQAPRDAALEGATVFGTVGATVAATCAARRQTLLRVGRQRRNAAARRIDDQRGAMVLVDLAAGIRHVRRVDQVRRRVFVRRRIEPLRGVRFETRDLFVVQELTFAEVSRTLERRDRLVVPDALQIGITPCRLRRVRLGVALRAKRNHGGRDNQTGDHGSRTRHDDS